MPRVHRWVGRITAFVVLCGLVPSGAWLSFEAKGGALGTLGFLLSGGIVALAMVRGVQAAIARDFVAHRRWMLHVGAQLSVAVTSRALLIAFDALGVDEIAGYLIALWVPVVASALLAQWICSAGSAIPTCIRCGTSRVVMRSSAVWPGWGAPSAGSRKAVSRPSAAWSTPASAARRAARGRSSSAKGRPPSPTTRPTSISAA